MGSCITSYRVARFNLEPELESSEYEMEAEPGFTTPSDTKLLPSNGFHQSKVIWITEHEGSGRENSDSGEGCLQRASYQHQPLGDFYDDVESSPEVYKTLTLNRRHRLSEEVPPTSDKQLLKERLLPPSPRGVGLGDWNSPADSDIDTTQLNTAHLYCFTKEAVLMMGGELKARQPSPKLRESWIDTSKTLFMITEERPEDSRDLSASSRNANSSRERSTSSPASQSISIIPLQEADSWDRTSIHVQLPSGLLRNSMLNSPSRSCTPYYVQYGALTPEENSANSTSTLNSFNPTSPGMGGTLNIHSPPAIDGNEGTGKIKVRHASPKMRESWIDTSKTLFFITEQRAEESNDAVFTSRKAQPHIDPTISPASQSISVIPIQDKEVWDHTKIRVEIPKALLRTSLISSPSRSCTPFYVQYGALTPEDQSRNSSTLNSKHSSPGTLINKNTPPKVTVEKRPKRRRSNSLPLLGDTPEAVRGRGQLVS